MALSLGARLRAQRERKQITLSAISEDTKIKVSVLEGLERDDVSQWPEGIFRRAYVRSYARAIGLDPEAVLREFLELHPDPVEVNPMASVSGKPRRVDAARIEPEPDRAAPVPQAPPARPRPEPGLIDAAALCTRLGRLGDARDAAPILDDAAAALDAVGLIVWFWDPRAGLLQPWLASGYAETMLARLPGVRPDADNAIAAAFASGEPSIVNGGDTMTGALAVPLLAHGGCAGVLAIELRHGDEGRESVRAFATIVAAQLVPLAGASPLAHAVNA